MPRDPRDERSGSRKGPPGRASDYRALFSARDHSAVSRKTPRGRVDHSGGGYVTTSPGPGGKRIRPRSDQRCRSQSSDSCREPLQRGTFALPACWPLSGPPESGGRGRSATGKVYSHARGSLPRSPGPAVLSNQRTASPDQLSQRPDRHRAGNGPDGLRYLTHSRDGSRSWTESGYCLPFARRHPSSTDARSRHVPATEGESVCIGTCKIYSRLSAERRCTKARKVQLNHYRPQHARDSFVDWGVDSDNGFRKPYPFSE